ncbi:MAG: hypothetical protein ABIA93_07800 [Candidatus Woesearchaeota archaeon]
MKKFILGVILALALFAAAASAYVDYGYYGNQGYSCIGSGCGYQNYNTYHVYYPSYPVYYHYGYGNNYGNYYGNYHGGQYGGYYGGYSGYNSYYNYRMPSYPYGVPCPYGGGDYWQGYRYHHFNC